MDLNNESKTLFIPLYGKALMSKQNLFIKDKKAEEIINNVEYNFKKLKQSKWLSMYMAARARQIDELCNGYIKENKNLVVIHLGCGLDSRALRVNQEYNMWYDLDFESVIELRKQYYKESEKYKMIGKSVTDLTWLQDIKECEEILIVAEGLTMYLSEEEIKDILVAINNKFKNVTLIFDAYSKKAVKASKIKNPVNQMNAQIKYGLDKMEDFLKLNSNLKFVNEYVIEYKKENLKGITKTIFEKVYCGKIAQSYYKIYEFKL
ncbi:MAG: class I SAM-dependent methyltransferase [Clostridia bacterium]|nr:class I SAM-dependent methyltransferase [Clostridia bacterium]